MQFHLLNFFLAILPFATSSTLHFTIPPNPHLPNPSVLPASTTALLTTLKIQNTTPLRTDNTFSFRNVTTGSYLLDVRCATHVFAALRVDVFSGHNEKVEAWGTFRGNEWENKGEGVNVRKIGGVGDAVWGMELQVLGEKDHLIARSGFSPLSLLRNPMILMAGFATLLVFGMPYIMDIMDPDMKAEFEERQKGSGALGGGQAASNPLQGFDAAAWLAGSKKTEEKGITR